MKTYVTRCTLLELKQLGSEFAGWLAPTFASLTIYLLHGLSMYFISVLLACNSLPACVRCTTPCSDRGNSGQTAVQSK